MAATLTDSAFESLVDANAEITQVATGFVFTEGPVWNPAGNFLVFSDIPASIRYRWDASSGITELLNPTSKANGLTYDNSMNLVACEHATSSVARFSPDGTREVLCSHFESKELNSPNDVVVKSDGSVWFTDPPYGRTFATVGVVRDLQLDFNGVYRLPPGHTAGDEPQLVVERGLFLKPNGLCFSPDESKLYVNDSEQRNIFVFEVSPDGSLQAGEVFADGIRGADRDSPPDGMKCDEFGNVWVTGPGGIWVYAPNGRKLGEISFPEEVANFAFGGEDWRTIFATAHTSLYSIKTNVGPRVEPFMNAMPKM